MNLPCHGTWYVIHREPSTNSCQMEAWISKHTNKCMNEEVYASLFSFEASFPNRTNHAVWSLSFFRCKFASKCVVLLCQARPLTFLTFVHLLSSPVDWDDAFLLYGLGDGSPERGRFLSRIPLPVWPSLNSAKCTAYLTMQLLGRLGAQNLSIKTCLSFTCPIKGSIVSVLEA